MRSVATTECASRGGRLLLAICACLGWACGPDATEVALGEAGAVARPIAASENCTAIAASAPALQAKLKRAKPGDVVCMQPGRWRDISFRFTGAGRSGKPITLAAREPGQTVVSGSSSIVISGKHLLVRGLRFEGGTSRGGRLIEFAQASRRCRLTETTVFGVDGTRGSSKWIVIGGRNNRVDHCWFSNKRNHGQMLIVDRPNASANYHRIDHNYFGRRPPAGQNGAETIRIGTSHQHESDSYTTVERNLFDRASGEAEIISSKSGRNTFVGNTFRGCQGTLTLRHGHRCRVEANYFLANGQRNAGGIRVIGSRHAVVNNYIEGVRGGVGGISLSSANPDTGRAGYEPVEDVLIAHNTVVNSERSIVLGKAARGGTVAPRRVRLSNNLIAAALGDAIVEQVGPGDYVWIANIVHGAAPGPLARRPGIRLVDPLMARVGSLWRPARASPVVDAGTGLSPAVTTDIDGATRTGQPDVGADEVGVFSRRNPPLLARDVGPLSYRP